MIAITLTMGIGIYGYLTDDKSYNIFEQMGNGLILYVIIMGMVASFIGGVL